MPARHTLALTSFLVTAALSLPAIADTKTVSGTGFELSASLPSVTKPGAPIELTLALVPTTGRKINDEFPLSITVAAPADVKVPRVKLGRADARVIGETRAVFPIALTPSTTGERTITLDVRFAVCSDRACEPQHESIAVSMSVR